MSTFARTFSIDLISDRVLRETPWFTDMLLDWRPAGDAIHRDMIEPHKLVSNGQILEEDPKRLRLAIRSGYLNLYRGGQSVAKIASVAADSKPGFTTNISTVTSAAVKPMSP
jgi:hypothetical protein